MADHPLGSLTGYTLHQGSRQQARLVSIGIGTEMPVASVAACGPADTFGHVDVSFSRRLLPR